MNLWSHKIAGNMLSIPAWLDYRKLEVRWPYSKSILIYFVIICLGSDIRSLRQVSDRPWISMIQLYVCLAKRMCGNANIIARNVHTV